MLESQKILRSMSEKRQELHTKRKQFDALADDVSPERRGEVAGEMGQIADDLSGLEPTYRTAVDAESKAIDDARRSGDREQPSAEVREYRDIESRATLSGFIRAVCRASQHQGRFCRGRAAHCDSGRGQAAATRDIVPWAMFLAQDKLAEIRAAFAPGSTVPAMQDPIIQEVFAASTAAFLGTRFESTPVGDALEFVLTSGGASMKAAGGSASAAGSLTATTLTPRRLTARYEVRQEHMYRVAGLESALRADIPRTMMDQLDKEVSLAARRPNSPKDSSTP